MATAKRQTETDALIRESREAIAALERLVARLEGTVNQCSDEKVSPQNPPTRKWWPNPNGLFGY